MGLFGEPLDELEDSNNGERRDSQRPEQAEDNEKGGKLRIQNVGGSLTFLLQVALLAWGIRQLRSVLAKRRDQTHASSRSSPKSFLSFSAAAVVELVKTDSLTPYVLVDIRPREALKSHPAPLGGVINIPARELRAALQLPHAAWEHRFGGCKQPDRKELLILLCSDGEESRRATDMASSLGYSRCYFLQGGLKALPDTAVSDGDWLTQRRQQLQIISRHALSLLLALREPGVEAPQHLRHVALVDLRRHDERALFGAIHGSLHIPADEWPRALCPEDADWAEERFGLCIRNKDRLLVLHCNTGNRAAWAALLALNAGWHRCVIYKAGTFGWSADASTLKYEDYREGSAPPQPLDFTVEPPDLVVGERELSDLGLV